MKGQMALDYDAIRSYFTTRNPDGLDASRYYIERCFEACGGRMTHEQWREDTVRLGKAIRTKLGLEMTRSTALHVFLDEE